MEISSSKMQIMKPVVLKAGISLAVTLAGFIFSKILTRGSPPPANSSSPPKTHVQKNDSCEALADDHKEEERCDLQEEILGLKCEIEDFRNREWRLKKCFLHYQELKDHEIALLELHNKFMLEINRVELLQREVTLLKAEKQRFDNIVDEYLEILRLLKFPRTENKPLPKRVNKLLMEKSLLFESKETDDSINKIELETKDDCIMAMEDEISELKLQIEQLLREKNQLSAQSEAEGEMTKTQVTGELGRLHNNEATDVKKLLYLRWHNACLRHGQVMRSQEQEQNKEIEHDFGGMVEIEGLMSSDHESSICHVGQNGSSSGPVDRNRHHHSKRRKLIEKFKRWVDKEKHGKNECFQGRYESEDGTNEAYFSSRKSCSSA